VWQWVPLDLFAELLPIPFKDEQEFTYTMRPASTQPADPAALMARAEALRGKLESSRYATTEPAE
jgi:hypothetical protein